MRTARTARTPWIAIAAIIAATSCTSDADPTPGTATPVVGTAERMARLDPAACDDYLCSTVVLPNTHEGLVRLEPDASVAPSLAESWVVTGEGRVYTFSLRQGVELHDGTPFDAQTMKRSLERLRTLAFSGPGSVLFDTVNDPPRRGVVALDAPDSSTLVVTLAEPDAALLSRLAMPAAAAVSPSRYPDDRIADNDTVVGTGPYRIERYEPGRRVDLVPHPGYWGPAPRARRIGIQLFDSPAALRTAVERGEVDIAVGRLTPADALALAAVPGVRTLEAPGAGTRLLVPSLAHEPYGQPELRRALAAAVDRPTISSEVFSGTVDPLYSMIPNHLGGHRPVFLERYGDADAAQVDAQLRAAGLPDDATVDLELAYTPDHYGATERAAAEQVKGALERTGRFAVTLRPLEWDAFREALGRGELSLSLVGWFPDFLDPDGYLHPFVSTAGARNLGSHYSDPETDALLVEQRLAVERPVREEVLVRLQDKLAEEVPYVPLWQTRQIAVVRDGVSGVELDASQAVRLSALTRQAASDPD